MVAHSLTRNELLAVRSHPLRWSNETMSAVISASTFAYQTRAIVLSGTYSASKCCPRDANHFASFFFFKKKRNFRQKFANLPKVCNSRTAHTTRPLSHGNTRQRCRHKVSGWRAATGCFLAGSWQQIVRLSAPASTGRWRPSPRSAATAWNRSDGWPRRL